MEFPRKSSEARALTVLHSDSLAALLIAVKQSSHKMLMNAFAAETALVLVELGAELILTQQSISKVC